jgi:hypothetical protein
MTVQKLHQLASLHMENENLRPNMNHPQGVTVGGGEGVEVEEEEKM